MHEIVDLPTLDHMPTTDGVNSSLHVVLNRPYRAFLLTQALLPQNLYESHSPPAPLLTQEDILR